MSPTDRSSKAEGWLAAELFVMAAGPALIKSIAEVLGPHRIPVMPLKGVLLQKMVFRQASFRPMADVDVLVPERHFLEACSLLGAHGFTDQRWEDGDWQVTLTKPGGPPFGIDLHRRLTRTARCRLTSAGMFARGTIDSELFGAPVVTPAPDDLFAHLLLHNTLHWLTLGRVHRPQDFEAVAAALSLDADRCARHVDEQGMSAHALLMLPLITRSAPGPFVPELISRLARNRRARGAASTARGLAARFPVGARTRRLAGLVLASSLPRALLSAARDRLSVRTRVRNDRPRR